MSRANSDAARMRRLKRIATRKGVTIMTILKSTPRTRAHGGYMVRDAQSKAILLGNADYEFSASLDEVDDYLSADGSGDQE
ncbi:hypothetical protein PSQ90_09440 [Devosia rhodophyticola]|uniref:Uncharacterized protein n=1 Tax=Devosia rhodophyticola TaxID=3026423 RepID=A0ABY7YTQ8_9HYPH|nr:hypothetical protein [Devosia rhodophyticola]WDR04557.1 hypothetical protein PSQ90_09440 [Devosia rhodophyticola]